MYFSFKFNFSYLLSLIYYLFHLSMMMNYEMSLFNLKYYFNVKHFNYMFDLSFNLISFMWYFVIKHLNYLFDY